MPSAGAYGPPGAGASQPPAQGASLPPADGYGAPGAGASQPSAQGASLPPANSYGASGAGASQPPAEGHGSSGAGAPLPPASEQPYGSPGGGAPMPPAGQGVSNPALPAPGRGANASPPPVVHGGGHAAPLPPADEGATQYLPPVAGGAEGGGTPYPGPAAAPAADEGATQYIPPVGPGALPPEVHAESPGESTQFLGLAPRGGGSRPGAGHRSTAGPMPSAGPLPPASGPDAEATQYIAPVPGPTGGDRQPPAEFDNLFRSGPGAAAPAGATQQMPRYQQPAPGAQPPYGQAAQPSYAGPPRTPAYDDGDGGRGGGRGGRSGSRLPLIAAVGIGIAVLGIGAGALLAGGGSNDKGDKKQTVSATAPATDGSASPSADPAKEQAVALDTLLADSGNSRTSVISAVASVKSCKNLGQAAKDLRDAAQQRTDLVTRLSGLTVDKLPDHVALTEALTKAWKASASADNHYAAWADQAAGKKGCKKGQARTTAQTQAGNQASGIASTEKTKAARLWNTIAKQYGLTERQPTQL
ncbi:hypothetical protein [Streptomyces sp. NPDC058678]|uniref:hypothetical protein n=1 Tax=Streptomyces sp. NPDC058678 TaxID=3346595 RepID=UPI00364A25BB